MLFCPLPHQSQVQDSKNGNTKKANKTKKMFTNKGWQSQVLALFYNQSSGPLIGFAWLINTSFHITHIHHVQLKDGNVINFHERSCLNH